MTMSKIAVVTGAGRGIGNEIANTLAAHGHSVVFTDIASPEALPDNAVFIPCDISNETARQNLLDKVVAQFGRIDLLVNNAGIAPAQRIDILDTSIESFRRLITVNLEGTFFMTQLFANQMVKQGGEGCRIINMASISSYTSSTSRGEYCVSKAGVSMVTQLFADRLAEHGIGVFEIRPGIILTDMTAVVKDKYTKLIDEGLTPIKRMGSPKDIAAVVLGIDSGYFDFCTGQVFNADGGFHIRRL